MSKEVSTLIPLASIKLAAGTQSRATVPPEVLEEYTEIVQSGKDLDKIVLFSENDNDYFPGDGHIRIDAYIAAGRDAIPAEVCRGGLREAVLYSVGANSAHGARRTNEDKRFAVQMLLNDPEWAEKSDRWIAERCRVSDKTVADVRVHCGNPQSNGDGGSKRTGRDGRTTRIGGKRQNSKTTLLCSKCKRLGVTENCEMCKAMHEQTKEDVKAAKKQAAADAKKAKEEAAAALAASKKKAADEAKAIKEQAKADAKALKQKARDDAKAAKQKAAEDAKAAKEKEKAERNAKPEGETAEDQMKRVNSSIESFCRGLMKYVDETLPEDHWLTDMNRRAGAVRKFKDGCEMMRSAKCSATCPPCKGSGKEDGKKCRPCHGTGRLPKLNLDQL